MAAIRYLPLKYKAVVAQNSKPFSTLEHKSQLGVGVQESPHVINVMITSSAA